MVRRFAAWAAGARRGRGDGEPLPSSGWAGGAIWRRCSAMKRPSTTASAMTRHMSEPERMASSLPGMT